jgi:hypothetical protein
MKVILNVTLKGSQIWMKGEDFDSSKKPLPSEIQFLVDTKSNLITIVPEPVAKPVMVKKEPDPPVVKQEEPVKVVEEEVKTALGEEKPVQEEKPVEVKPKLTKKTADVKPRATIIKKVRK